MESKPSAVKHNLGVITRTIKLCKKLGYDVCTVEPPTVKVKNTKTRALTKDEDTKLLESFLVDKGPGITKANRLTSPMMRKIISISVQRVSV